MRDMSYREPHDEKPLLIAAFGGRVFGMDAATGARMWFYEPEHTSVGEVRLVPTVQGLFVLTNRVLACLDAATGEVTWSVRVSQGATLLVETDSVFVGGAGEVRCYARANGQLLWEDKFTWMGQGAVALALGTNVAQADQVR
jgi:outer membrane protein assembly factor BamB